MQKKEDTTEIRSKKFKKKPKQYWFAQEMYILESIVIFWALPNFKHTYKY